MSDVRNRPSRGPPSAETLGYQPAIGHRQCGTYTTKVCFVAKFAGAVQIYVRCGISQSLRPDDDALMCNVNDVRDFLETRLKFFSLFPAVKTQ